MEGIVTYMVARFALIPGPVTEGDCELVPIVRFEIGLGYPATDKNDAGEVVNQEQVRRGYFCMTPDLIRDYAADMLRWADMAEELRKRVAKPSEQAP